jgi:hypothetical protein
VFTLERLFALDLLRALFDRPDLGDRDLGDRKELTEDDPDDDPPLPERSETRGSFTGEGLPRARLCASIWKSMSLLSFATRICSRLLARGRYDDRIMCSIE